MSALSIILFLLTAFAGSFIQSVCGFGSPIVCMSVLPYFMEYATSLALSGLLTFSSNVGNVITRLKFINIKLILSPLIGYFAFAAFAIVYSVHQAGAVLSTMLGVLLILLSLYFLFFNGRIKIKPTFMNGLIIGAIAGVMGGLFGIIAPPIVIWSMAVTSNKDEFITTNLAIGLVTNIYSTTVRALSGAITKQMLILWLIGSVMIVLGVFLGRKVVNKINPETMKKLIYLLMAVSGLVMII